MHGKLITIPCEVLAPDSAFEGMLPGLGIGPLQVLQSFLGGLCLHHIALGQLHQVLPIPGNMLEYLEVQQYSVWNRIVKNRRKPEPKPCTKGIIQHTVEVLKSSSANSDGPALQEWAQHQFYNYQHYLQ